MAELQAPPARAKPGRKPKRQNGKTANGSTPAPSKEEVAAPASSPSHLNELEEHINDLGESWETESLFEEILEDLTEDQAALAAANPESCSPEEAVRYRQELRAIGPEEFCRRTVDAGVISAKKLLTAFGVRPPSFLEGEPDESYFGLLSLALSRELLKRAKLMRYNSVDDAVHLLQTSRNIVVLTGAGISTSLGIPDFRSKNTGLYARLDHLGLSDPQEVFDINVFREDPTIFYSVARDILPSTNRFTPTHAFIAMLQQRGKLLTNYSQNIDNLEAKAGIKPSKLVQCHGSFATASCVQCGYQVEGESIFPTIRAGGIPRCPRCAPKPRVTANSRKRKAIMAAARDARRQSGSLSRSNSSENIAGSASASGAEIPSGGGPVRRGRPRGSRGRVGRPVGRPPRASRRTGNSSSSADDDGAGDDDDSSLDLPSRGGVMKPDITFFGEPLPDEFSRRLTEHDRDQVDLVVVIGTSLKVAPVSEVVPFMPAHVPQIYISRTPVHHINFDIDLLGDCDVVVAELCRRLGWDLNHDMVPPNQVVEIETQPEGSQHVFTDVTPGLVKKEEKDEAVASAALARDKESSEEGLEDAKMEDVEEDEIGDEDDEDDSMSRSTDPTPKTETEEAN